MILAGGPNAGEHYEHLDSWYIQVMPKSWNVKSWEYSAFSDSPIAIKPIYYQRKDVSWAYYEDGQWVKVYTIVYAHESATDEEIQLAAYLSYYE